MPFAPKVAEITREFQPSGPSLKADLARFIHQRYGVEVPPSAWSADALPTHLRPRVEVVGNDQKVLAAGRDFGQLRQQLERIEVQPRKESPAWELLTARWERFGVTSWNFAPCPSA